MKIKTLLIVSLLFGLWAGSANAQSPVSLPHTQNFDGNQMHGWRFDPEGWVDDYGIPMSVLDVAGDDAYLNHGELNGCSFYFGSASPSDQDSYLISPELAGTENGIHLSFYYSNIFIGATTFQVGYSTFTDDLEDFVWGAVITASGSDYWENGSATWMQKEMDFPRNVKYIAFSMTRNQSSTLCIDDIVIASANCALPALFQVTGTTSNSITLSWQDYGESYSYDIQYANTQIFDFEQGFGGWTSFGDGRENTWLCDGEEAGHDGSDKCAYSTLTYPKVNPNNPDEEPVYFDYDNYLVSPLMDLSCSVSFYAKAGSLWSKAEFAGTQFEVMVYPGSNISEADSASFVKIGEGTISDDWKEFDFTISGYDDGQQGYLIIRHINDIDDETWDISYLLIDDVTILEWATQNTANTNFTFEDLDPATIYTFRMRGNVGENHSSWTDLLQVKTFPADAPNSYAFINEGDWNVASNWENWYMPQDVGDDVTVEAAAVIPEGCVAKGTIAIYNGSITIKDGGQLVHNNASGNISVTAKKRIWAYPTEPTEGNTGYYLIASPIVAATAPADVVNMTDNNYDLYSFDQNEEDEWQNYEEHGFSLSPMQGYLYANSGKVTLKFTGAINPSNNNITVNNLGYTEGAEFKGWNLVGNPFMCNAFINKEDFFVLNESGSEVVMATESAIAPLQGVFVKATSESDAITFSREVAQSKGSVLNVNVIRKEANVDVARVRFGEGEGLEKFQLNPNHTKVYFTQNGKNYAVVNTNGIDELPCNFKAEEDGTYTLSFTKEQVEFNYLHLIDNLTGADVDLLQQPEYTFTAKSNDYASRFRVVFVAKDTEGIAEDSETFAFNSYGSWIIVNEGFATLQMVDINGRMICNETIEGYTSMKFNVAPGVYVLRLVNGENVRVQKVIVR